MIYTTLPVAQLCKNQVIALGRQMENNYRQIIFDVSDFDEPITSLMLVHQRKGDAAPYIVDNVTGTQFAWTITDTDTAYAGYGKGELRINFANGLAKSIVFTTMVVKSITGDTQIPSPLQSWYDAMIDYINEHAASPEQIEAAVEAYLDEHPIQAPVQSVNGKQGAVVLTATDVGAMPSSYTAPVSSVNTKTGDVVLTASDVGALSDQTTIPTKTSDLTNDSGFITSVPVTSVNSKTGAVTLNASDVGALPSTYTAPVQSVDGKTGAVQIMPTGGSTGQVLTKTASGTAWQTPQAGGAVDSVNGQTGTVVLDADDVGALPDTTTASDLGAYVKPSGGIPKTDLASAVQTSLGKADTALQTAPVTSVNGATGAVVIGNATTSAAGLMSATDKSHLDDVYADYSSALTALGVI